MCGVCWDSVLHVGKTIPRFVQNTALVGDQHRRTWIFWTEMIEQFIHKDRSVGNRRHDQIGDAHISPGNVECLRLTTRFAVFEHRASPPRRPHQVAAGRRYPLRRLQPSPNLPLR